MSGPQRVVLDEVPPEERLGAITLSELRAKVTADCLERSSAIADARLDEACVIDPASREAYHALFETTARAEIEKALWTLAASLRDGRCLH